MTHTVQAGTPPRSAADQARFERKLAEAFEERIPFNRLVGVKVLSLADSDVRVGFAMKPELVGSYHSGRLHGGVICTVLDATAGVALAVAMGARHPHDTEAQLLARLVRLGTIDMRVDFLRPGLSSSYVASAEVLRLGGRVGTVQMRLADADGQLVASGAGSFIIS